MSGQSQRMLLSGNHAVAWGARLCRPQVCPVYPITPQTPILEKITEFVTAGEMQAEIITPESEHSAMAASIAAVAISEMGASKAVSTERAAPAAKALRVCLCLAW